MLIFLPFDSLEPKTSASASSTPQSILGAPLSPIAEDTPAKLEDCDYNTSRVHSGFSSVNTPRGTEFVQLDFSVVKLGSGHSIASPTNSTNDLLADLEDMESEWEGQLDSKVTPVAATPRKNNLQKYKKGSKAPKQATTASCSPILCTEI